MPFQKNTEMPSDLKGGILIWTQDNIWIITGGKSVVFWWLEA